jgi:DNA polymerase-3 subunit gamma/tau
MMSQALYRKWRPQKWDEVAGQDHVIKTLHNAVAGDRIGHAYLFSGPRGTGKTSVARLLAKAANCLDANLAERPCNQCLHCQAVNKGSFLDLIEIDAASNNGVEDVRDLRDKINFSPNQGKFKVYIIDEVHMLSTPAFNALLKTLEEPPAHAIFILATTEMHKIPATVLSRCQRHEFKRASVEAIAGQLRQIAVSENISADDEALILIARQATGSFRDAISLLDQMASTGEKITLKTTHQVLGTAASQSVLGLVDSIQDQQPAEGLKRLHAALDAGTDPRVLARQVVDYLRVLLMIKLKNEAQANLPAENLEQARKHADAFSTPVILYMVKAFNTAATDLRGGWQPALSLELALIEVLESLVEKKATFPFQQARSTVETPKAESDRIETRKVPQETKRKTDDQPEEKAAVQAIKAGEDDFEKVVKGWKRVGSALKTNMSLNALLNSCRPMELKNGVLSLGFASEILQKKANTPEQIETIRKTIADLLELDLQVKCVVSNARQTAPADIKQDGMVAEALKIGGKITDIHD